MKKSKLRKLIREVISEQTLDPSQWQNQTAPEFYKIDSTKWVMKCPEGYKWGPWWTPQMSMQSGTNINPSMGVRIDGPADNPWAISTGCIKKGVDVKPQNDDDGKPGKGNIPKPPTSPGAFNKPDPLGDAPVGGGGFGTANLGDLPSS